MEAKQEACDAGMGGNSEKRENNIDLYPAIKIHWR
jgi:hypothetical protein